MIAKLKLNNKAKNTAQEDPVDVKSILWKRRVNNIYRHLRPAPFTNREFHEWLAVQQQKHSGLCSYCGTKLWAQNLSVDHEQPKSRGGNTHFLNLAISCLLCNRLKGKMNGVEFRGLMHTVSIFEPEAQMDFWARLLAGGRRYRRG